MKRSPFLGTKRYPDTARLTISHRDETGETDGTDGTNYFCRGGFMPPCRFWRDEPAATSEREQNSRVDAHNGLLRKFSHNLCEELPHFFRIAQTEARLGGSLAPDADSDPVRERPKSRFIGGIVAYVDGQRRLWKLRHEGEDSGALPLNLRRQHLPDLLARKHAQVRPKALGQLEDLSSRPPRAPVWSAA